MRSILIFLTLMFSYAASPIFGADEVMERAVQNQPGVMQQTTRIGTPIQPATVEQQLAALQQQVQALQTQVAALQSVLKVTPTSATLQAPSISIFSSGDTLIQSSKGITVKAASGITVQSQAGTSIKAGSTATIEASGTTELKGAVIKLNGGSKPIATVGSQVQVPGQPIGQVTTGNGTILSN